MSVLVAKWRDFFSGLWLDFELMFSKKPSSEKPEESSQAPKIVMPSSVATGIMPVFSHETSPPSTSHFLNLMSQKAKEKSDRIKNTKLPFSLRHLRLSKKGRLFFYDQMATLIGSGVPLIDALSLIQAQERNKHVKALYAEMIHQINGGLSLSDTMEFFPHIFPAMQSALIDAAEASGNLKEVLAELVTDMEENDDFLTKITGAMVYPIILLVLAVILVAGMMIFVIPKVAAMYQQSNIKLPALTQMVINISDFIVQQWPLLLGSLAGSLVLIYLFLTQVRMGKLFGEKFISLIPIAGRLSKEKNLMTICATMSMLLKSGVLITEAFSITQNTISNLHYREALEKIRQGVVMGKEVSQMMGLADIRTQRFEENKLFPLQVAQLIHIGEKTGTIAVMLFKIKKNYHKSIESALKNISTLIEPLMIFIVAALVGSILMAVMLPFFYIGSTIH